MIERIHVNLGNRSHDIVIGSDILDELPSYLREFSDRFYVITDSIVEKLYGQRLCKRIQKEDIPVNMLVIPAGEQSKSLDEWRRLLHEIGEYEFATYGYSAFFPLATKPGIVALGGGVVGDLAGFVASTYMLGSPLIQAPVTLLSQVDSSIGGKNGVNDGTLKNAWGTVYQPKLIFIDTSTPRTLPEGEVRSQASEVVKYGIISDVELFEYLERHIDELPRLDEEVAMKVVKRCAEIKAGVISRDETSLNERVILNYGHTFGHAFETLSGYKDSHGDDIRKGMHYAVGLGNMLGITDKETLKRQDELLRRLGPLEASSVMLKQDKLVRLLYGDKKIEKGEELIFVFPKTIGTMATTGDGKYRIPVSEVDVRKFLKEISNPKTI